MRSYRVLAEGGLPMWDDLKAKSLGIIQVLTDDLEITLCHLLGSNRDSIRVGTYAPTRYDLNTRETGRRYKSQVIEIRKSRITSLIQHG